MGSIKILGGGISGLTAAINLKKAGLDVEVHERKGTCGKITNDFQFLENWSFNENVIDFLARINIKTDFYLKPWHRQEFLSPSLRKHLGSSIEPLMYLVKRGRARDSIDGSLEAQCRDEGVRIFLHSTLKTNEADIVATGLKDPTFLVSGLKFKFDATDRSLVLLDNALSSRCYSYFIVNDGIGEIACANPCGFKDIQARLRLTVTRFEEALNASIENVEETFSSVINFGFLSKAKVGNQYLVGEAAGFQDHLAGFGMVYAFKSGYCAARSIVDNTEYDALWKKAFLRQLRVSSKNRMLYESLSNEDYERIIDLLNSRNPVVRHIMGGEDFQHLMKKLYNRSLPLLLRFLLFHRPGSRFKI